MREKKEVKPLTEQELDKAINYYPPKKGKGTDQHTTVHSRRLPREAKQKLLQVLEKAERQA
eukprot:8056105-Lingulodinium_polyedra.AAC.1